MQNPGRRLGPLAAIAASSALIAGGILAASAALAEPTATSSNAVVPVEQARHVVAAPTPAPAVRLPESHPERAQSLAATGRFSGTQEELNRAIRASMIRRFDPNDESLSPSPATPEAIATLGPTPCNSCDPLDLDNPSSPNYDPTILAVYQEDDVLPPPDGPGFATCNGLSATGPFWAGANDQCWGPDGASGMDADNVERQIPALTSIGQRYEICGQIGLINTSGYTGDPNNPGGPLKAEDADVWELHIPAGIELKITGYAEVANLRWAITFNGIAFSEGLGYAQFRDCNDDYYIHPVWPPWIISTTAPCADDITFRRFMAAGYYYVLMDAVTGAPQGVPGAQLCEYWYNLVIEVPDPEGACCVGDTCTDEVAQTACFGIGGVFRGSTVSCANAVCCDVLAELAGENLTPDYSEGDTAFNPFTEQRCNIPGSTDANPGCGFTENGEQIAGFPDAGEPVQNISGELLDVCADPDKFVIVGYSGTPDAFESTFFNSQFAVTADADAFVFENNSGAAQSLTFDGFAAPAGVWQLQLNAGGYPDGGAFDYSCDISEFIGIVAQPCQRTSFSHCVPDETTWSFGFRNLELVGISCDTPYWFSIDCAPCPKVACCLPNGDCVDGLDAAECNNFLHPAAADGVPGTSWSSCCYITCPNVCEGAGIPSGSVADDTCANTNPITGDLFNSGCDTPDGNPIGKFSTIGFPATQSWCGSTGSFVRTPPAANPTITRTETDYYLIDLSAASNDVGVRITVTPSSRMSMYLVPDRGPSECPPIGNDGTDDVRELGETTAYTLEPGVTRVLDLCLAQGTQNMLVFEADGLVACGSPYHVEIQYFTDGCKAACCNAYLNQAGSGPQGCTLVADLADTPTNEAFQTCSSESLRGTYRGLNTRCTGVDAVTCCTVAQVGGDIPDADNNACPSNSFVDTNRGCISPSGGAFQSLGTFAPGVGPSPGTTVTVWGAVCRQSVPSANPFSDNDFYSVNVNSASGAEYLCTVETNARIAVYAYSGADLGLPTNCNSYSPNRDVLFNPTKPTDPCAGPASVAASGINASGESFCLLGNQLNYFLVQPTVINDGVEAKYRMTLTAYECRMGACCLDAALCIDDVGFLQCEAVNGGQFVAGASCPDDAASLALCRGICCVDTGPGAPVCVPDTTAYDCCVYLNEGSFGFDSSFAGYTVGDLASQFDCATNPDACEEGACCVDSASGYTCQDNLSTAQCGALTGLFQGIGSDCADVLCAEHPCCFGSICNENFSPIECANSGGIYKPFDSSCTNVQCIPTGACCFSCTDLVLAPCPEPSGPVVTCVIMTSGKCFNLNGVYVGDDTTCTQGVGGPCDCAGDINRDGKCNTSDFSILAGSFGTGTPNCLNRGQGDLNCDGIINAADFNVLAGCFGCVRD